MKVLLVVDMQNDFISGSLGTDEAPKILPFVEERIRTATDDIILFTQDTHEDDYLETQEGRRLPVKHCIRDTEGWNIHPSLLKAWEENPHTQRLEGISSNAVIKHTFGSKELVEILQALSEDKPIQRIEIMGLCTDICVISNAFLLKAYFPEATIQVSEKGCAGVTTESHDTALAALKACQVDII